MIEIRCKAAVGAIEKRLDKLVHPEAGIIKLVQFNHDSPGLRKLRRQISEALILQLETEFTITKKRVKRDAA